MRVLVVADVHANLAAFEAVIADARRAAGFDAVWCLGDTVGYGAEPGACIALLRRFKHIAIAGNHDLAAAGAIGVEEFNPAAAAAIAWTAPRLTAEEREYLLSLPSHCEQEAFTLVHGSLLDPVWDYLVTEDVAQHHLSLQTTPYGLVGHSHRPLIFAEGPRGITGRRVPADEAVALAEARLVANPGSAGQPRDGDPRAAYALLDTVERSLLFRRVGYDIERTQSAMRREGLPSPLVERLARGY